MNIPLLNQPDPNAPIDATRLAEEFQAGQSEFMDVPLSQTHLSCLALAAQRTLYQADCSAPVREKLLEFLGWCARHAEFGVETRKLLAEQAAHFHMTNGGLDAHGVQTPGREEESGGRSQES